MIYYSFFTDFYNKCCPEKNQIIKIILEDTYNNQILENDVVIATDEINVRFPPNNLNIIELRNKHIDQKLILVLADLPFKVPYYNSKYELGIEDYILDFLEILKCADEIWATEPNIVNACLEQHLNAKHFILHHTDKLKRITNNIQPNIDVLLYGPLDFFSIDVLKLLSDLKLEVCHADNFDILNQLLPRAKVVLNLPYENEFYQGQIKLRYLISNHKCVVAKKSLRNHFPQVIETSTDDIITTICSLLENDQWKNYTNKENIKMDNNLNLKPVLKNKTKKIVMMSMFQNEAKTIGRMLESCYKYIDYWVLQDNGSTDGTPNVVQEFFKDKNVPGFIYQVKEGWVGFGWNRDHLIQTVRNTDHGCDWILKMDCDEVLVVDDDFDWSIFDNTDIPSFHVPALANGIFYQRAWIYNARKPFRFNHDDAHETCYIEGIGEGFPRVDLPKSFRHETYDDGQSYGVRTKYLTDALKLEERLIREETMLTDRYHFWYIGKSYYDCYRGDFYPLGRKHSEEFARRSIWYFNEWLNVTHNYETTGQPDRIDEMAYYAVMLNGLTYRFLNDNNRAVECFIKAAAFSPPRNEHLMRLAELYQAEGQFNQMYEVTSYMMRPERVSPFPEYHFMIESTAYHNTSDYLFNLHNFAQQQSTGITNNQPITSLTQSETSLNLNLKVNTNMKKRLFVIDNFYENPDDIRKFALSLEFQQDLRYYKGLRSKTNFKPSGLKEVFESIIGEKITVWDEHFYNGCFQITTAEDPQVYHHDLQKWAAMIYLTPDAPIESGTRLHKSKLSGARHADDPGIDQAFAGGFIDSTKFDIVDQAGNVYNRLVIMDAKAIHSAGPYFGTNNQSGRLIHLFFFD